MNSIIHSQRYLPHTIETRFHAVKLYRGGSSVRFVCRRYHISKASLMRWNKRFDGTKQSLADKSHRPLSIHTNAHTDLELKWIRDLHRRNPHISIGEMYGKLRSQKGYSRHPGSLYRIYRKMGFSSKAPSTKKKRKPQNTTRQKIWASNGRWTSNMFQAPVMSVKCRISSTNTR